MAKRSSSVTAARGPGLSAEQRDWIKEQLGPDPGAWSGYAEISEEAVAKETYAIAGNIHGHSAMAGKGIVAIGLLLARLKELLPHQQFVECVEVEFGWPPRWSQTLIQVAEHLSTVDSSGRSPSVAQALALLDSLRKAG